MRTLSLIILGILAFVLLSARMMSDSPHGKDFRLSCDLCHSVKGWKLDKDIYSFDHNSTAFPLSGQHTVINCRQCHPTLVFSDAGTACIGCHTDMHEQTVGPDCGRCHTSNSWIVENITEIHQRSRFPLIGPHYTAGCDKCHPSASLLRFEPQGVECFDCHFVDYNSTTQPNHVQAGYSKNCIECHSHKGFTWTGSSIDHSFFPLTEGHAIGDCGQCHVNGNYNISPDCAACHQKNYNVTTNPNHTSLSLPITCNDCHTTVPGWKPVTFSIHDNYYVITGAHTAIAVNCVVCHNGNYVSTPNTCKGCHMEDYNQTTNPSHVSAQFPTDCEACHNQDAWIPSTMDHDGQYFPVYSGKHEGTWTNCVECHTNPSNYGLFSCIDCHEHNKTETDAQHTGVGGYEYNSIACYACHPTGEKQGSFNHSNSGFPLTGAHITTSCLDCHTSGFSGTPTECAACHINNYNQTTNPGHVSLSIPTTCATCHTTNPGWKPAAFPDHNNYYALTGAHASIASNCLVCHNGNYTSTPNTCEGCHMDDYNQTTNPPHASAQFPTDCQSCHNQNTWVPSTFNHDGQYFPIYSGKHAGQWNLCSDCHINPANYGIFSCIDCHEHNKTDMDEKHQGVSGYAYNSIACYTCHPTGGGGKMMEFRIQRKQD